MRHLLRIVAFSLLLPLAAFAQAPDAFNNFAHLPGTETQPLGQLGHVEQRGQGPIDVILIPGAAFGWQVFEAFMDEHRAYFTMYAVTLPGYGGTPPPPMSPREDFTEPIWLDAVDEALARLIEEEGLEQPVVVGHHLQGTYHALQLGLKYPDRVRAVVTVAGEPSRVLTRQSRRATMTPEARAENVRTQWQPFFETVSVERWKQGQYAAGFYSTDSLRGQILWDEAAAVPVPTQVHYFLEYMNQDVTPTLPNLSVPALAILPISPRLQGSRSEAFRRVATPVWTQDGAVPIRVAFVPNSGAFVMHDQPGLFHTLLCDFIYTLD